MFFISHRYDTRLYLRQTQARLPISVARHQKNAWDDGRNGRNGDEGNGMGKTR